MHDIVQGLHTYPDLAHDLGFSVPDHDDKHLQGLFRSLEHLKFSNPQSITLAEFIHRVFSEAEEQATESAPASQQRFSTGEEEKGNEQQQQQQEEVVVEDEEDWWHRKQNGGPILHRFDPEYEEQPSPGAPTAAAGDHASSPSPSPPGSPAPKSSPSERTAQRP